MEIINKVLIGALDSNISYAVLMDIVIGFLFLANCILGGIIGARTEKFSVKKFLFGVLKALIIMFIIIGTCYVLNVFTLTLNLIEGVNIGTEMVSTLELLGILITNGIDIAKEVLEKVKAFRDLKYVSYDDILISDTNIIEPTELKG